MSGFVLGLGLAAGLFLGAGTPASGHAARSSVAGVWEGALTPPSGALHLRFELPDEGGTGTMDVLEQHATGIEVQVTEQAANNVVLEVRIPGSAARVQGTRHGERIDGTFSQGGMDLPLTLSRTSTAAPRPLSPPHVARPTSVSEAQALLGDWGGSVEAPHGNIRVGLHFSAKDGVVMGTWEVPAQGLHGLAFDTAVLEGTRVYCSGPLPGSQPISFDGVLEGDTIRGTYRQSGLGFSFVVGRGAQATVRAQPRSTPEYTEHLVTVANGPVRLAGTLTLPRRSSRPTVLVFITGSGPQSRDEELFGIPIFGILADALARHGVASLRLDDRGVGESTGSFASATTADFATDTEAAVLYLQARKDLGMGSIGLLGHSEGGMIAPMVATRNPAIELLVLLAPPAEPGDVLLQDQSERMMKAAGIKAEVIAERARFNRLVYDAVKAGRPLKPLADHLPAGVSREEFAPMLQQLASPWFVAFLHSDPEATLRKVRVPTLAVFGSLDLQVPPQTNVPRLQAALQAAENQRAQVLVLPGLNHLFQRAQSGSVDEYPRLAKALDPSLLESLVKWLERVH